MKAVLVIVFVGCVSLHGLGDELVPDAFIDVQAIAPDIQLEMRYVTDDNFVGAPVDGYLDPICYLVRPAAAALAKVQEAVQSDGYGLVMFDCYRPQRAVNHFVRWSRVRMPRPSSSTSPILINLSCSNWDTSLNVPDTVGARRWMSGF